MPTAVDSEAALVEAARNGDQDAFALLIHMHRRKIWSICLRITENTPDAEDAVQDCLIAAWHHLDAFGGRSTFGTWLFRIAANSSLAIIRRRRPHVDLDHVPEVGEPDRSNRITDADMITTALRTLPLTFRTAVILREVGDLSYRQIAEHEGIDIQTVKSRISRGRAMMRAAVGSMTVE